MVGCRYREVLPAVSMAIAATVVAWMLRPPVQGRRDPVHPVRGEPAVPSAPVAACAVAFVSVPDLQVRVAYGRGQPGPAGQLAGAAEPGYVADLGHHDQRGELPDARQRPEHLDPRVGFRCRQTSLGLLSRACIFTRSVLLPG